MPRTGELEQRYRLPSGILDGLLLAANGEGPYKTSRGAYQQAGVAFDKQDLDRESDAAAARLRGLLDQAKGHLPTALAMFQLGDRRIANEGLSKALPEEIARVKTALDHVRAQPQPDYKALGELRAKSPKQSPQREPVDLRQRAIDAGAGLLRGAAGIGATLLYPLDVAARYLNEGQPVNVGGYDIAGQDRRAQSDAALRTMGASPDSDVYQAGKVTGELYGTAGAGGALAGGLRAVAPGAIASSPTLAALAEAIGSSGAAGGGLGTRAAGGAIAGGASAGLANPGQAELGAGVGALLPGVGKVASGLLANDLPVALVGRGGPLSLRSVLELARQQGIDIAEKDLYSSHVSRAALGALSKALGMGRMDAAVQVLGAIALGKLGAAGLNDALGAAAGPVYRFAPAVAGSLGPRDVHPFQAAGRGLLDLNDQLLQSGY